MYPNPKRPVNVLRGTDPDPYFIWKWDPNPCRPEKCLKCTTWSRRGPDHYSKVGPEPGWEDTDPTAPDRHILHSKCYEVNKRCEENNLFALTTVSSPLPDCDAYNPPCQYISIHVRLFLSLAVWKSFLIHSLFQLQKSTCCHGDGWLMQLRSFFFIWSQLRLLRLPFWTTITILFVGCNKDSEQLFFLAKNAQN